MLYITLIVVFMALIVWGVIDVLLTGPTQPTTPRSRQPTPTARREHYLGDTGYLVSFDPSVSVLVINEIRPHSPTDAQQAMLWALRGEACLAEPGTKAWWDAGKKFSFTRTHVEVAEGRCMGFRGWVPSEFYQPHPP
ncbi:MAG: hypothetical protein H8D43_02970 [Chloroflexi bacterium]|nr:hypothetical protein [Chloroflexota bacterium]